jgi:Zn-dependent M28 family amino/carboxypeptidase
VVFAALGAEETGMEGAAALMDDPPEGYEPSDVVYNVNMDMIGSYSSTGMVHALGTVAGTDGVVGVEAAPADVPDLEVGLGDTSDQSDNFEFCSRGIPYLFFWTEDRDCYHETCDVAERIDARHMVEVARLTGTTTELLAATEADLYAAVRQGADVCEG